MSTVVAIIYNNEICLASDTKCTDHETGLELESSIKQIVINNEIAIGFAGSGNIAQVIMDTLSSAKNSQIISTLTFAEIPKVLDSIYRDHIAQKQYPDKEMCNVSALTIGINNCKPEIIFWNCSGTVEIINQSNTNNFTAFILPPYDMTQKSCNEILLGLANAKLQFTTISEIVSDYFKITSSISNFVSEIATIWTHTTLRPDNIS